MGNQLFDFSNPIISAAIVHADGKRMPLWVNTDRAGNPDLPPMLTISDLTVEIGLGYVPKITATLVMNYGDAMDLFEEDKIRWLEDEIEVQFGYMGSEGKAVLSPVYNGFLLPPDVSIGTETTITLSGQGMAGWSSQRNGRGLPLNGVTRLEAIEQLAKGPSTQNPRKVRIDTSMVTDESLALLTQNKITIAKGYVSEWHLILQLVRNAQCWLRHDFDPKTREDILTIFSLSSVYKGTPKWRFMMFSPTAQFGPSNGVYPILSFNSPTTSIYYAATAHGIYVRNIDSKTGEAKTQKIDSSGASVTGGGAGEAKDSAKTPKPDDKKQEGGAHASSDQASQYDIERVKSNVMSSLPAAQGVRIEIETIGVPDLVPGALIQLKGMNKLFNYDYAIHEMTHSLGTGGYTTSFVAYSNSGTLQANFEKVFGTVLNAPANISEESGSEASPTQG